MAASELEIEPDLNKAPPHVEGELLKQNTKGMLGKKGWTKFYFIVLRDKLQFFRKREDYKQNKEPVAFVRMSQVTEITEVVFDGVPKKYHLNCGFSIVSFHPITQQQQTFNLLTETPEDMRYWVHALRYIRAYWAKMEVRDTVLSEEQERKILERILSEEDLNEDVLPGEYSLDKDGQVTSSIEAEPTKSITIVVHFTDGSKVTVKLPSTGTASDLLEKVKDKLTSSAAQLWLVDVNGDDMLLDPKDQLALHQSKKNKFYALDPSHRILVVFFNTRDFDSIAVPSNTSALEVIEHRDISVQLDIKGVANRGLFLKSKDEEHIFSAAECPCDVLFSVNTSGKITRQSVGRLVIKNKALGGGRATTRLRFRTVHKQAARGGAADKLRIREEQEEEAQSKALDMLIKKKTAVGVSQETVHEMDDSWINITDSQSTDVSPKQRFSEPNCDSRGFEEAINVSVNLGRQNRTASVPASAIANSLPLRPRSSAVHRESSPLAPRKRVSSTTHADLEKLQKSPLTSPTHSPTLTTAPAPRSRSRSPRRLPDEPKSGSNSPLMRKGATRTGKRASVPAVSEASRRGGSLIESIGKGPTIVLSGEQKKRLSGSPEKKSSSPPGSTRSRNHATLVKKKSGQGSAIVEGLKADSSRSRSSAFGVTSPVATNLTPEMLFQSKSPAKRTENDDERFEKLFSRSFQLEQEELNSKNFKAVDTLTSKYQAVNKEGKAAEEEEEGSKTEEHKEPEKETVQPPEELPRPMVIDFSRLAKTTPTPSADIGSPAAAKPLAPIEVHSPSLLKVILLQASATTTGSVESRPMDLISLSGVCLRNDRGKWRLQEGCNFHDPLPLECEDHTESFPLAGGVRVIYNHTHKRWHVLPPHTPTPSIDESRSEVDSTERSQSFDDKDGSESSELQVSLYTQKKLIVTEIGTAAQQILSQFERTRDNEEKKRIGSDMTNLTMGNMIRGRFCSAIAGLLCDGLKPSRLGGLIQDDIWKVAVAFCHEAQRNHTSPLVFLAFDKFIFQPISSMKTLKDNNMKFRTFVCLAMSKGLLVNLLEALPKQKDTLRKYYLPSSLLVQGSEGGAYCKLYKQMLLDVEPIAYLPFDLSIDFEIKQAQAPKSIQQNGTVGQRLQPKQPQAPLRPSVVIKTHAATGQKTGNVISAVWQTPVEASAQPSGREETDTSKQQSGVQALRTLQQQHLAPPPPATSLSASPSPSPSPSPMHSPSRSPVPPTAQDSWFKRLASSLNAGGAITGPPKRLQPQVPSVKPPLRKVRALYKNMAEDADELSFNKGDVMTVKEQINGEWLICIHGNESGIVPINYVQDLP